MMISFSWRKATAARVPKKWLLEESGVKEKKLSVKTNVKCLKTMKVAGVDSKVVIMCGMK